LQIDGLKGLRVEKTILDGDIVWSGAV
jgi:hypothetical protein